MKMMRKRFGKLVWLAVAAGLLAVSATSFAQPRTPPRPGQQAAPPASAAAPAATGEAATPPAPRNYNRGPFRQSFLFSQADIINIKRAELGQRTSQTMVESQENVPEIPRERRLILSGVLNRGPGNWIVWLNGHKLTPSYLLPEIVDIKVEDDKIHLKWFDIGLNDVINITLRPHQTYDIVTGILLPG